jgi:hypothetical protein
MNSHQTYTTADEGYRLAQRMVLDAAENNEAFHTLDSQTKMRMVATASKLLYVTRCDLRDWHSLGAAGCLEIVIKLMAKGFLDGAAARRETKGIS